MLQKSLSMKLLTEFDQIDSQERESEILIRNTENLPNALTKDYLHDCVPARSH